MQNGGQSPEGAEVWHHMQNEGHMVFSRSLQQTPAHTPPPIPNTQPQEYAPSSKQLAVPPATLATSGLGSTDDSGSHYQRLSNMGSFLSRYDNGPLMPSGPGSRLMSGNGTPLSGMATPYQTCGATITPNPHEHYAAINQAVMDKVYAKLYGENFVHYIQNESVVLGRRTKAPAPDGSAQAGEPDVDLGASKSISRKHATIRFDSENESFTIEVHGKNGLQVDLVFYKAGSTPVQLFNGSRIQIANVGFWFFLPQGSLSSSTEPFALATQVHLRYLASRSPSPASAMTVPNSRAVSRNNSPEPDLRPMKKIKPSPSLKRQPNDYKPQVRGFTAPAAVSDTKPLLTYAELIIEALQAHGGRLNLKAIYDYIRTKHPYYRNLVDQDGWKNSIRHNLSLNVDFVKTKRLPHEPVVKGNYWTYIPNNTAAKKKSDSPKKPAPKRPAKRKSSTSSAM